MITLLLNGYRSNWPTGVMYIIFSLYSVYLPLAMELCNYIPAFTHLRIKLHQRIREVVMNNPSCFTSLFLITSGKNILRTVCSVGVLKTAEEFSINHNNEE